MLSAAWAAIGLRTQAQKAVGVYVLTTLVVAHSTALVYGAFLLVVGYFAIAFVLGGFNLRVRRARVQTIDLVPLAILLAWLYGVVLGLIKGNAAAYVFTNFVGFIVFFAYYLLMRAKVSRDAALQLLLWAGVIVIGRNVLVVVLYFVAGIDVYGNPIAQALFGEYVGGSSTGQIRLYNATQLLALPVLALATCRLLLGTNKLTTCARGILKFRSVTSTLLTLALASYVVIFMPASKGFVLAAMVVFFLSFFIVKGRKSGLGNLRKVAVAFFLILCVGGVLLASGYSNIVQAMFSEEDEGNIPRFIQLYDLMQDMVPAGRGLGAAVPGNIRDEDRPYGFELSFVNVAHKLGMVSALVFFAYLFSFWKAASTLRSSGENWRYSAAALGGICYLLPSIGNPIISSPQLVLMHCLSLYLIRSHVNDD